MPKYHNCYAGRLSSGLPVWKLSVLAKFWICCSYNQICTKTCGTHKFWHDYDLCFMKLGGALGVKFTDIDRQHTHTARLCSPRAIRSKKSEAWFHELKECIWFISKLSSYLGFRWLTPSPLNIDPQNNSMENMIHFLFSVLGGFCKIFKIGGMLSSLSTHS